jgi:hypothetical protein
MKIYKLQNNTSNGGGVHGGGIVLGKPRFGKQS